MNDNELRDRIAKIIDKTDMEAGDEDDHNIGLAESVDVAHAIIDELGLTHEVQGKGDDESTHFQRIVGKWEKQ